MDTGTDVGRLVQDARHLRERAEQALARSEALAERGARARAASRAARTAVCKGRLSRLGPAWPREAARVLFAALSDENIDRLEALLPPAELALAADAVRALERLLPPPSHHFRPRLHAR